MARIPSSDGKSFCIDSTEVTQGDYRAFLDDKKGDVSGQTEDGTCQQRNKTFEPKEPDIIHGGGCWPKGWSKTETSQPKLPMVCVDWCDARAYCEWAGKRLCGKIGGGPLSHDEAVASKESELAYVCSQGGKSKYPYGEQYQAGACNVEKAALQEQEKQKEAKPVGEENGCHGTSQPYNKVFDLVGNVHEWENGAYQGKNGEDGDVEWTYPFRGGGSVIFEPDTSLVTCSYTQQTGWGTPGNIGFRCCAD